MASIVVLGYCIKVMDLMMRYQCEFYVYITRRLVNWTEVVI